jgi:hypothetical protein
LLFLPPRLNFYKNIYFQVTLGFPCHDFFKSNR